MNLLFIAFRDNDDHKNLLRCILIYYLSFSFLFKVEFYMISFFFLLYALVLFFRIKILITSIPSFQFFRSDRKFFFVFHPFHETVHLL